MVSQSTRDRIIKRIVKLLYDERAYNWAVQDKGVLLAAIKLALQKANNQG